MWIDIVFLVVLLYGFWQGWNQGIIGTLLNLAIYAFGIVIAYKMAPVTSVVLEKVFNSSHPLMFVGGFLANMLLIYVIVNLASKSLEDAAHGAYLGMFNRLLGGGAIGAFYVLLYSIIIWFLGQANGISSETISTSRTYDFLKPLPGYAKGIAVRFQPMAFDSWSDFNQWMDKAKDFGMEKTDGKGRVYEIPEADNNKPLFESKPEQTAPARERNAIED